MTMAMLWKSVRSTAKNITEHEVGQSAAALTYYLLFALFPMLIFISNLLGMLELNVTAITTYLLRIMPDDVVYLLEAYLNYVQEESSGTLLWFSLAFSVFFPFRAVRSLTRGVRRAYQLEKPEKPIRHAIRQVIFTVAFLLIVIAAFALSVFGRRFVSLVTSWLELGKFLQIPPPLLRLWQYLRFALVGALMFAIILMLHLVALGTRYSVKSLMPGIVLSLISWLTVSICFSVYVENFGNYSVIYGTLGTVIVLLIWLYMTSFLLILGAEFNASLYTIRKEISSAHTEEVNEFTTRNNEIFDSK